jgi:RHS repeat-associated protein
VVTISDANGHATTYTYDQMDRRVSRTNPYQFTGRENDGTGLGLYFYRARYYNPTLQRFIAQDPIGFAGGDSNLYRYVYEDPADLIDPPGRGRVSHWSIFCRTSANGWRTSRGSRSRWCLQAVIVGYKRGPMDQRVCCDPKVIRTGPLETSAASAKRNNHEGA